MALRVFVRDSDRCRELAVRPPRPFQVDDADVEVFTDGSCVQNGFADARAGAGAWFGEADERNCGERPPYDRQSNQIAEMYAVLMAHRRVPPHVALHIVTDSKYVIEGLTVHLPKWERIGWVGVANADVIAETASALRSRCALTTFRWVKGHSGVRGNEEADRLAGEAADLPTPFRPISLPPPRRYLPPGASLAHLTQRLAYQGICTWKPLPERATTGKQLALVRNAVLAVTGVDYTAETVWTLLRSDPVSKKVRDFLWKALHGAHKVGAYWKNIPGYEARATCAVCSALDSMEHILVDCQIPGSGHVWRLATALLDGAGLVPPPISAGIALGGHLMVHKDDEDKVKGGATRLARIVLTESARLIWVLRCERVITWADQPGKVHSLREIENRWLHVLNKRFDLDRAMTSKRVAGERALQDGTVLGTWTGTLKDEASLPNDWIRTAGVLVGRPTLRNGDEGA